VDMELSFEQALIEVWRQASSRTRRSLSLRQGITPSGGSQNEFCGKRPSFW